MIKGSAHVFHHWQQSRFDLGPLYLRFMVDRDTWTGLSLSTLGFTVTIVPPNFHAYLQVSTAPIRRANW